MVEQPDLARKTWVRFPPPPHLEIRTTGYREWPVVGLNGGRSEGSESSRLQEIVNPDVRFGAEVGHSLSTWRLRAVRQPQRLEPKPDKESGRSQLDLGLID